MYTEKRLNNIRIKPIIQVDTEKRSVKGWQLFDVKNWITYICSRKKSGKTSLINGIIDKTTSKKTVIWVFCPTHKIDKTWISIINKLEEKGYIVNTFDSIQEGTGAKKINNLSVILDDLAGGDYATSKDKSSKPVDDIKTDRFGNPSKTNAKIFSEKPKRKKPKVRVASNLFILDDCTNELKNPAVNRLCKTHRHSNSNIIISSQYPHDLTPQAIAQIDYLIAFKGHNPEKIEHLHRVLDLGMDLKLFDGMYNHCVSKPYEFLYLNVRDENVRRNFNMKLNVDY